MKKHSLKSLRFPFTLVCVVFFSVVAFENIFRISSFAKYRETREKTKSRISGESSAPNMSRKAIMNEKKGLKNEGKTLEMAM